MKLCVVRHDDIASLLITDHQAVLPFGRVKGHQQTQAGINAVLMTLARRWVLGSAVDPLNDVLESQVTERS